MKLFFTFQHTKNNFFPSKKDLILQSNKSGKQAKGVQRFSRYPTETHQGFQIFHSDFISHRRTKKIFYEHFSQHFETFEISSRLVSPYGAQKRIYCTTWNCAVEGEELGGDESECELNEWTEQTYEQSKTLDPKSSLLIMWEFFSYISTQNLDFYLLCRLFFLSSFAFQICVSFEHQIHLSHTLSH